MKPLRLCFISGIVLILVLSTICIAEVSPTIISVRSDPSGATVWLDNREIDVTPHDFVVKDGRHEIKVLKIGYTTYVNKDVVATLGMKTSVFASLRPDPYYGTISVRALLGSEGAEILVDGVMRGTTILGETLISNLPDGSHVVTVRKEGYKEYRESVVTGPDADTNGLQNVVLVNLKENLIENPKQTEVKTEGSILASTTIQTTAPPVQKGTLTITSNPPGASIILNGEQKGLTPQTFKDLPVGSYPIGLTFAGYEPITTEVSVQTGQVVIKDVVLKPLPTQQPTVAPTTVATTPPAPAKTPIPTQKSGMPFGIISILSIALVLFILVRRDDR